MPPFRNPFARRPGAASVVSADGQHLRPDATTPTTEHPGFERVDTVGSKASSAISIRSWRSEKSLDNGDYKMSVVNDSGIYLPPSPTEERGLWPRQYDTRKSTDTKSSLGEIEPFGISRESFDSYRRSFDVTARSPVIYEAPLRSSLDSARLPHAPRTGIDGHRRPFQTREPPTPEEFEDVGLEDKTPAANPTSRKRGFFAKLSASVTTSEPTTTENQITGVSKWISSGRKRATSIGQGSEMKPMSTLTSPIITTTDMDEDKDEESPETPTEVTARESLRT